MKEYLPIGSIITIGDSKQKLMIYGRGQIMRNNEQVWDYVACMYPYGHIDEKFNCFFNHADISEIIWVGYVDKEELIFKEHLYNI
ncbi:DUF4176 domain-containing protein [Bacillus sp. BGMRC 2118]|nr:DUF4176 domain-containing protein [Bacillus sp. BGMRC 2118]